MAQPSPSFPFLYRPMVAAALGGGLGIVFFRTLTGTGPLLALCLFSILGFACWLKGLLPLRTFCLAVVFALLRVALLPELSLPSSIMAPFVQAREALLHITGRLFPQQDGALLSAMLWGDKSQLDTSLRAAYQGAGVAHILALSGLHVSFVAMALNWLTRRVDIRLRLTLTAMALFTYCAIAAFPASLLRATLMCLCPLSAQAMGKKKDQASSIAFAALCILFCAPSALWDIGFQLSFGAVIAIAMLAVPLTERLPFPRELSESISVSICGLLGTLPLSAYHFKELPLLSLFANLLILPLVPLAFLWSMTACFLGLLYYPLGDLMAPVGRLLLNGMNGAAKAVAGFPLSLMEVPKPSLLSCFLFYGAMLVLSRFCLLPARKKALAAAGLFAAAFLLMV